MYPSVGPNNGPILQYLWRRTGRIVDRSLGNSDKLSPIVGTCACTIITVENWQRSHSTLAPDEGKTDQVRAETAEVFPQRIWRRRVGEACDLPSCTHLREC